MGLGGEGGEGSEGEEDGGLKEVRRRGKGGEGGSVKGLAIFGANWLSYEEPISPCVSSQ